MRAHHAHQKLVRRLNEDVQHDLIVDGQVASGMGLGKRQARESSSFLPMSGLGRPAPALWYEYRPTDSSPLLPLDLDSDVVIREYDAFSEGRRRHPDSRDDGGHRDPTGT